MRPSLHTVLLFSRTAANTEKFAAEARVMFPALSIRVCASVEEAVKGADIVAMVSGATEPVLKREWIKKGAHLVLVGACRPTWRSVLSQLLSDRCANYASLCLG